MGEVPEKPQGLHVEEINSDTLDEIKHSFLDLQFNALDTNKNRDLEMRKHMKSANVYRDYLKSGAYGTVLVAKDNDKIIGLLTLNRDDHSGTIDQIWLATPHDQGKILERLLDSAKEHLRQHNCTKAIIKADNPNPDFRRVFHHGDIERFFTLEAKDN